MTKKKNFAKKKIIIIVVVAVLIGFVFFSCSKVKDMAQFTTVQVERRDITTYLEFTGNVEAANSSKIFAKTAGEVTEVFVEEGSFVKEGDVIAKLDTTDVEYNIALQEKNLETSKLQNEYALKDSQKALNNLQIQINTGKHSGINASNDSVNRAANNHDEAAQNYIKAQDKYNKAKKALDNDSTDSIMDAKCSYGLAKETADKLYVSGSHEWNVYMNQSTISLENARRSARKEVESLEEAMNAAKKTYESAVETYENAVRDLGTTQLGIEQSIQNYKDSIEKTNALSSYETSQMQIDKLKKSLDNYTITSNLSGYVTKLNIAKGDSVGNGVSQVAEVMNLDTMQVKIKIDEYDIAKVNVGEEVDIYVTALDAHYEGKIAKMDKVAQATNGVSYIGAVVEFKADDKIISGLSSEIKLVKIDEKDVIALPVDTVEYEIDNRAYVYQYNDKREEVKKYVTLGVSDGEYVQIVDGLYEGEEVLKKPSADDIAKMMAEINVE